MMLGTRYGIERSGGFQRLGLIMDRLNGPLHKRALKIFLAITIAHWLEHLTQAYQLYIMHWPRHDALGLLGYFFPLLIHSEWLHYGYALVMLVGLVVLRPAFTGRARMWWDIALIIQIWHHFEHLLLLGQAISGTNLFGRPNPTSILQLVFPRAELHLVYNALVFIPMVVGMFYHFNPLAKETQVPTCSCSNSRQEVIPS